MPNAPLDLGGSPNTDSRDAGVHRTLDAALARLDDAQGAFVAEMRTGSGNIQALAGAGSGKTTATVAAIGALIRDGIDAADIVATTFTSKAGKELADRLAAVVPAAALARLRVGTFHGIALRAIRANGAAWAMPRCMDIGERAEGIPASRLLWSKVLGWSDVPGLNRKGLDLDLERLGLAVGDYAMAADLIRSTGVDCDDVGARAATAAVRLPMFWEAWVLFEAAKAAIGAWDFADALSAYRKGLLDGSIRDRAAIVIVDEAQDNSIVQLDIAKALAQGGRLALVGDVRQAIYEWRGAAPNVFAGAGATLGAVRRELPYNYRSDDRIVAVGNAVAAGQPWSVGAVAVPRRGHVGGVGILPGAQTPMEEAEAVAERIAAELGSGTRPDAFAILARTNAMLGAFEAACVKARIPCVVVGGVPFFTRKEVLDVLAYAALIQHDSVTQCERIVNRPKRFLGKVFTDALKSAHRPGADIVATIRSLATGRFQRGATQLADHIADLRAAGWPTPEDVRAHKLGGLGLIHGMLRPPPEAGERADDTDTAGLYAAAVAIAATFPSAKELVAFAMECGAKVAGVSETGDVSRAAQGRVTISTIHRAKGLEWVHVFLSASEGVFPHKRSIDAAATGKPEKLAEEARCFYVAVTRARDTLTCTWSEENLYGKDAGPSRFLDHVGPFRTDNPPVGGGPTGGDHYEDPADGGDDNGQDEDGVDDPALGGTGLSALASYRVEQSALGGEIRRPVVRTITGRTPHEPPMHNFPMPRAAPPVFRGATGRVAHSDRACDDRCLFARGHDCTCSCGGANHGRGRHNQRHGLDPRVGMAE